MVWAKKNTSVLAVGVSFSSATLPFPPALIVNRRTFEEAEAELATAAYSVMVVDATGKEDRAKQLIEVARALHPNMRIIFAARRTPANPPTKGETLVAANGRQLVRGLRTMLGC